MKFIAFKTADGAHKGNISFYCRLLHVTRQGFYQYLVSKDRPWKYQELADAMMQIHAEDECNDTYGRSRMYQALKCYYIKEALINSATPSWCIFFARTVSTNPPHSFGSVWVVSLFGQKFCTNQTDFILSATPFLMIEKRIRNILCRFYILILK